MMRGIVPLNERSGTTGAPTRRGLLDGNRIGRRKGVLEGFVERLFLAPALIAIAIVLIRFAFRIGDHSAAFQVHSLRRFIPASSATSPLTFKNLVRASGLDYMSAGPFLK